MVLTVRRWAEASVWRINGSKDRERPREIELQKCSRTIRERIAVLRYVLSPSLTYDRLNWTHCRLTSRIDEAKEEEEKRQGIASRRFKPYWIVYSRFLHFSFWLVHRPKTHTSLKFDAPMHHPLSWLRPRFDFAIKSFQMTWVDHVDCIQRRISKH